MFGVSKDTVLKLQVEAGYLAADYQDKNLRDPTCKRIQVDEVWAFCFAKQKNVSAELAAKQHAGDVWTWTAIDADTKLIAAFTVGNRDMQTALVLMEDLAGRLRGRIQLTSDGLKAYRDAVELVFGAEIDYAQLIKTFESTQEETRYSPAKCVSCEPRKVVGNPDPDHISTSFVERSNLSIRMGLRRFTRLTNAFSKKIENHAAAVALYFMHYNYCRVHQSLRVTPCMEANVTNHIRTVKEMLQAIGLPCGSFEPSN
jgi:IS1 family transposase